MGADLTGKKLLVLGGRPAATVDIVKLARQRGVYTIVTDNLPEKRSPAKSLANEQWDISTADVKELVKRVKERKIDGVICGSHEFNLMRVKEICAECNLPFYASEQQLRLNFDKLYFKQSCKAFGLSVPKEYDPLPAEREKIRYPVIVKPRDGSGGRGITICYDPKELDGAISFAKLNSPSQRIVIEEYLIGREITAVYAFNEGAISLSCVRDRYPVKEFEHVSAQYDVSLIPSKHTERFYAEDHPKFVQMLEAVNAWNGCAFFQGIVNKEKIAFFECGYRLNGLCDYHNIEQLNGINYLEMMVEYALEGKAEGYDLDRNNPFPQGVSAIFNLTAHHGVINRQKGLERVQDLEHVIAADYLHTVSDEIIENSGLAQSVFRAHICGETRAELAETIEKIQKLVSVTDVAGNNMLFHPFDTERLYCE